MIKIRISILENIKDFFVFLGALLIAGYFTLTSILAILSIWLESLQGITDFLATYGLYFSLIALGLVIVFYLSIPLLAVLYFPFKLLQAIFSIFVEFLSDEEYEEYLLSLKNQRDKAS
ncbi:MAG: hypothetical protein ACTTH5_08175 [Wolinella sp.]